MKALPPRSRDVLMAEQQDLIDRGEDPLDEFLNDQADEDARRDRQHDHTPIFRSTAA